MSYNPQCKACGVKFLGSVLDVVPFHNYGSNAPGLLDGAPVCLGSPKMKRGTAADTLWGAKPLRAARWAILGRSGERSAILANIGHSYVDGMISYRTALLTAIDALSVRAIELQEIAAQRRDKATGLPRIKPANIPTDEQIREALRDNDLDVMAHWIKRLEWADEVTAREVTQLMQMAQQINHTPIDLDPQGFRAEAEGIFRCPEKRSKL